MNAISLLCSKKRVTLVWIELTLQEIELTTLSRSRDVVDQFPALATSLCLWIEQHTMPEAREGIASGKPANNGFETAKATGASFILQGIAAEATKYEVGLCSASSEIKEGLVYGLNAYSTLQYLTHTSVQFYPREKWEKSIRNVSKDVRKFSIGVAFIFTSQVLAFPSIDMVFQPTWATALSDFSIPPNIFSSTGEFPVLVAVWIESILLKPRYTRACDTIRDCNNIFYSIGVYTVMELFFMAGSLQQSFPHCPAFYSYIARSEQDLWTPLQPCIHDGILAPMTYQCLWCADWLYVWEKERTSMPLRIPRLVDEFHRVGLRLFQLCNVFEPTILGPGLESQMNLGHLIFGDNAWLSLGGRRCAEDDPITAVYRKHNSLSVSIGPLEYCGVGHIIYIGPNAYVAVCKGDPMIPEYHEKHFLSGLDHMGSHLDTTGKYKWARSQKELRRLVKKLTTIEKGYKRAGVDLEVPVHDKSKNQPSKPKKRRLNADQRLVLAPIN
ncbi:hypothetical protein B0H10DRAFT_2394288 [Mycena sp. CBHHK59/15]|nr:hypothetical protein B0H10DRAFT_2394288 [Mycena sp. CBHHK59/15]